MDRSELGPAARRFEEICDSYGGISSISIYDDSAVFSCNLGEKGFIKLSYYVRGSYRSYDLTYIFKDFPEYRDLAKKVREVYDLIP